MLKQTAASVRTIKSRGKPTISSAMVRLACPELAEGVNKNKYNLACPEPAEGWAGNQQQMIKTME